MMGNPIRNTRNQRIINVVNNRIRRTGMTASLLLKAEESGSLLFDDSDNSGSFTSIPLVYGVYNNVNRQSFVSSSDDTYSYRPSPRLFGSVDDFGTLDIGLLKLSYIDAEDGLYRIADVLVRNDYIVEILVEVVDRNGFDFGMVVS